MKINFLAKLLRRFSEESTPFSEEKVPRPVAAVIVSFINPDVQFETHNYNITTMDNFQHFISRMKYEIQLII